jgi:NodT family efflux transporter outer membrane factor (OMF) lipoprotein
MNKLTNLAWCAVISSFAAGCSVAPPLQQPVFKVASSYREIGPWVPAQPADSLPRGNWWTIFGNVEIDHLESRLLANSPNLAAALADYEKARAISDQAHAGLFPIFGVNGNVARERGSATIANPLPRPAYNLASLGGGVSYEADLWGKVRNTVTAGDANASAAGNNLQNARLLLSAQLVDDYLQLRGLDEYADVLDQTIAAYDRALRLTRRRHEAGIASGLDIAFAQTQFDNTRSRREQISAQRALLEHAIAALIGETASDFSIKPAVVDISLPRVSVDVPSNLLQRRPDVAAAQRRMEAANANIGVARAAFFPAITLAAQGGYQSQRFGNLLTVPSEIWAIGPSVALTLLDGGLRKAQVAQARAEFDATAAAYRKTALNAFAEVEDNLALINHYDDAIGAKRSALDAAQRSLSMAQKLYDKGAADYLTVLTAQTSTLQTRLDASTLRTSQLRASVALIRAIGGGWSTVEETAEVKPVSDAVVRR